MGRFIPDGVLQVWLVEDLDDIHVPTVAEILAGDHMTGFLRQMQTPLDGSIVDAADPTSKYNKTMAGTYGGQPVNVQWYRDENFEDDDAFNALPRGAVTNAVIFRRGCSGETAEDEWEMPEPDEGDRCDIWPRLTVVTRNPADYTRNEPTGFTTEFSVGGEPAEDVALVAGA